MAACAKFNYSEEGLKRKIEDYFAFCDEEKRFYTRYGLATFLGVSMETLDVWEKGTGTRKAGSTKTAALRKTYSEEIKKAMTKINAQVEERVDTKSVFLAKQPCYMGYADREKRDAGTSEVVVRLDIAQTGKDGR